MNPFVDLSLQYSFVDDGSHDGLTDRSTDVVVEIQNKYNLEIVGLVK